MTCQFIKPDGTQCQAKAIKGDTLCFTHNPEYANQKAIAVSNGGLARRLYEAYGEPFKIETPKDIAKILVEVINGVWTGKIPCSQPANTIGFLSRCFLDAYEMGEMEARITALEGRI